MKETPFGLMGYFWLQFFKWPLGKKIACPVSSSYNTPFMCVCVSERHTRRTCQSNTFCWSVCSTFGGADDQRLRWDPQGGPSGRRSQCLHESPPVGFQLPPANPSWAEQIFHSPAPITANKSRPLWLSAIWAARRDKRTPGGAPELSAAPPPSPRRRHIRDTCACRKQRQRREAFNALFKVRHRINSVTMKCCLLSFDAGPEKTLQVALDFDVEGRKSKTLTRSDSGEL